MSGEPKNRPPKVPIASVLGKKDMKTGLITFGVIYGVATLLLIRQAFEPNVIAFFLSGSASAFFIFYAFQNGGIPRRILKFIGWHIIAMADENEWGE